MEIGEWDGSCGGGSGDVAGGDSLVICVAGKGDREGGARREFGHVGWMLKTREVCIFNPPMTGPELDAGLFCYCLRCIYTHARAHI